MRTELPNLEAEVSLRGRVETDSQRGDAPCLPSGCSRDRPRFGLALAYTNTFDWQLGCYSPFFNFGGVGYLND